MSKPMLSNALTALRHERRFVRLFNRAWRLIPLAARRRICSHWRKKSFGLFDGIIISVGELKEGILAEVSYVGHRMEFAPWSLQLSDGVLIGLILHELGHVYCHATSSLAHCVLVYGIYDRSREDEVDETLVNWKLTRYGKLLAFFCGDPTALQV